MLPDDVCEGFVQAFNLTYDNATELFLIDDVTRQKLRELNPQLTFRLSNTTDDTHGSFVDIVLPYAAFDLAASYPLYSKPTNYFPIRRALNADSYTLGRAFLQQAYLIVNYGTKTFSIDQAIFPDPMPSPNVVAISPPGYSPSGPSVSEGAIAGIVAGLCSGVVLLGIAAWLLWRRRKKHRAELLGSGTRTSTGENRPQELASNIPRNVPELGTEGTLCEMSGLSSLVYEVEGDPKFSPGPCG